ncbi:dockerin type I repeat-containing protein [Ruminococcus sp. HUN007]|uniref:dockerin type I repeat-containing protein n=1 Tax=Ruminococcus sp. HUN007 TaxID=1514668 RepID=UPI0005D167A1|nr:dockerin type I repeat-containing protein [Ruminococcus sp. HUN007]
MNTDFFVLDNEYKDTVYDLLKHNSNVVKIEECQSILECESALTNFCIKTDLSIDEVYEEYPGLLLENGRKLRESDKDWCDAPEDWSYVFSCKGRKDTETYPSFYSSIKKLHDNNIPFGYDVLIATEYGRQQSATSSELIYNAANTVIVGDVDCNTLIDVTDLTDLSLALIGDKELTEDQQKAADIDGDGSVTLADLARLQQYLSKKIDKL